MITPSLDQLAGRLRHRGQFTPNATLYVEGVKAKLRQAHFSLQNVRSFEQHPSGSTTGGTSTMTGQSTLTTHELVVFYCECFWDFLRSSLDILAQLINELYSLQVSEKDVDFKKVYTKVKAVTPNNALKKKMETCLKSAAFKELEEYRHCSTHRRQVFIEERTIIKAGTAGYQYSGGSMHTNRYLCSNPWDLVPRVDYNIEVGPHFEVLLRKINWYIATIVNSM